MNAQLYEEPIKLLQDDVKDIVKTATIMSFVGSGANRLSEIAARCNEPATNLSRPLKKLIDLGFLEKEVPFGVDEKNSKKSLYKIADPFLAFYYQFVVPNRSFIELDRRTPIEVLLKTRLPILPFASHHILVPVLFLKHKPQDIETSEQSPSNGRIMLPKEVINLFL